MTAKHGTIGQMAPVSMKLQINLNHIKKEFAKNKCSQQKTNHFYSI